jgi:Fe-S-cluster-containing hydrogenase component 2
VDAVKMVDDQPRVDLDWCIGCGVCAIQCPAHVISINRRIEHQAPQNVVELHRQIKKEKGL